MSIILIRYLHLKRVISTLLTSISKVLFTIAVFIHVDDMDLNMMNPEYKDIE